jgi:hypothetical protein
MADHLSERDDLTLRTLAFIERPTVAEQRPRALCECAGRARQDENVAEIVRLMLASRRERRDRGGNVINLERRRFSRRRPWRTRRGPRLLSHVSAAVAAAEAAGQHEGQWHLRPIALPDGPGDFTPYEYAEAELSPFGELLGRLSEVLGPDHTQAIAEREVEAGS